MDLEQLRKDREEGAPGPWVWQDEEECLVGPIQIVARQDENGGIHILNDADARRFTRIPDLEAGVLADAAVIAAADALAVAVRQCGHYAGMDLARVNGALAAYNAAKDQALAGMTATGERTDG